MTALKWGVCGITSVYYRLPQDDKYGLLQALLSNLSKIASEHFQLHIAYKDAFVSVCVCVYKRGEFKHLDCVDYCPVVHVDRF